MKDIVCAEAELSIAANQIVNYADFLATSIETYISILSDVKTKGIEDVWAFLQLTQLAAQVLPYKWTVVGRAKKVQSEVTSYIEDVDAADKFRFPEDPTSEISSILSQFL